MFKYYDATIIFSINNQDQKFNYCEELTHKNFFFKFIMKIKIGY